MSKVYRLQRVQVLPVKIAEAWAFFSSAENLKAITPPHLGFNIISTQYGDTMYAGQLIEYIVKPAQGIPVYWMTEITHFRPMLYFIDEQRMGPYSFWHHEHHFKEVEEGVEMTDIVHYKVPFWFLGGIVNSLFVRSSLKKIFDYREQVTDNIFRKK
jgi:ligand-binding SRPBCC domain-containing protein